MTSPTLDTYPAIDWVFLAIGVCLVVLALMFGRRWQAFSSVDFSSEKYGTMKVPFAPLLILVGVAFAGVGVYFRWQEKQSGRDELQKLQVQVENLSQELEKFKNYEMHVELDFHDSVDPAKLQTELFLAKPGAAPRSIYEGTLQSTPDRNILYATVSSLGPGDTFYFRTTDSASTPPRIWQSAKLVVPEAQLDMALVK